MNSNQSLDASLKEKFNPKRKNILLLTFIDKSI